MADNAVLWLALLGGFISMAIIGIADEITKERARRKRNR